MLTWDDMQEMALDVKARGLEPLWLHGILLVVHAKHLCLPPCPIHAPSDHHMVEWPLRWRSDARKFERMCRHGVGHPDPDDLGFKRRKGLGEHWGVHGCDSCCQ